MAQKGRTVNNVWTPSKYNIYKVTTEHGVSKRMMGETSAVVRKDFHHAMPNVKIRKIEFIR